MCVAHKAYTDRGGATARGKAIASLPVEARSQEQIAALREHNRRHNAGKRALRAATYERESIAEKVMSGARRATRGFDDEAAATVMAKKQRRLEHNRSRQRTWAC